MLQESLRSARCAAQVPPLGVQLAQCEQFETRAQKRLAALDEERVKLVSELEEGQARLQRLLVETAQRPQETNPTAPVPPPDWAAELQRLQSFVSQLQEESIQLGPRHLEEELQDLRWKDVLRHERFSCCRKTISWIRHHHGRGGRDWSKFRSNGSSHRRRRVETTQDGSRPLHDMMMFVVRGARWVVGNACGRGLSSRPTIEAAAESVFHAP